MPELFNQYTLLVDAQPRTLDPDWVVRFVDEGGRLRPILYYKGKRVTRPFLIGLLAFDPGDPEGASANTA